MKHDVMKVVFVVFLLSITIEELSAKFFNRLVIVLDSEQNEQEGFIFTTMTSSMLEGLMEATTPVLASTSLVKNFLRLSSDTKNLENLAKLEKYCKDGGLAEKFKKFEVSGFEEPDLEKLAFPVVKNMLTLDDWLIFTQKFIQKDKPAEPLILFIPNAYAKKQQEQFDKTLQEQTEQLSELKKVLTNYTTQEPSKEWVEKVSAEGKTYSSVEQKQYYKEEQKYFQEEYDTLEKKLTAIHGIIDAADESKKVLVQCGFNPESLHKQDVKSLDDLKTLPVDSQSAETFLEAMESIFLPRTSSLGSWLFNLNGHGDANVGSGLTSEQSKMLSQYQSERKKRLEDVAQRISRQADLEKWVTAWQPTLDYFNFDISHSVVADIPFDLFVTYSDQEHEVLPFLNFCNTEINTSFLFVSTCFSGGYNQKFLEDILKNISVDFYLGLSGVADVVVGPQDYLYLSYDKDAKKFVPKSHVQWGKFFDYIERIMGGQKSLPLWKTAFQYADAKNLRLRFPGINKIFMPDLLFSKDSFELTNTIEKAYEIEKKAINALNKKLVIVEPQSVLVPLNIGKDTCIACVSQPKIPQRFLYGTKEYAQYSTAKKHYFDQIITQSESIKQFLNHVLAYFGPHPISIFIKNLTCSVGSSDIKDMVGVGNHKKLSNMIISGTNPGLVSLSFTLENQRYALNKDLKEYDYDMKHISTEAGEDLFVQTTALTDKQIAEMTGPESPFISLKASEFVGRSAKSPTEIVCDALETFRAKLLKLQTVIA